MHRDRCAILAQLRLEQYGESIRTRGEFRVSQGAIAALVGDTLGHATCPLIDTIKDIHGGMENVADNDQKGESVWSNPAFRHQKKEASGPNRSSFLEL